MNKTSVPWADYTWNPITGCTKGCDYCYARGIAQRFKDTGDSDECAVRINEHWQAAPRDVFPAGFAPTFYPHRLDEPLRLKKPSVIFLGSMGDLFDPAFPDEFRDRIFATIAATQHTYMMLTKQSENMRRYFTERVGGIPRHDIAWSRMVPNNLWLGVTVTNQADADERIPLLLGTPAAHRFVSVEPMLGPVDLRSWLHTFEDSGVEYGHGMSLTRVGRTVSRLNAVIVGAKTPGKPLHEQRRFVGDGHADEYEMPAGASWLRSLRDQCLAAGVPFHYKHGKHNAALDGVVYDWRPEVAR